MTQVRAVIVNHNTASLVDRCMRDLERQVGVRIEILVVDACSRAEDYASLLRLAAGRATVHRCSQPTGYSACLNLGMKPASRIQPDYYLLMNSDLEFAGTRTVASLVDGLSSSPASVAASPLIRERRSATCPESGEQVREVPGYADLLVSNSWLLRRLPVLRRIYRNLWYQSQRPYRRNSLYSCGSVNGAMFLVKREHMEDVGYLDENVFLYMEEAIFGHRARAAGRSCCLVTESVVDHLQGEATGYTVRASFNGRMFDMLTDSECYYVRRYLKMGHAAVALLRLVRAIDKLGMRFLWEWYTRRKYRGAAASGLASTRTKGSHEFSA